MAETVQEKSRGMKFAEQQLLRHGWEKGKGLGREENGISEAIKVKVKCDKSGVGHCHSEQFTFHWWDHVFNKASSSLEVESDQNGVKMRKLVEEDEQGLISNKKPRKASMAKAKLYGRFVKSATLLSGQELSEQKPSSSDDSNSSDDEDQRLDLSSTTKLSDADLLKACGGLTAHKGARHGLTMSAKLARLEQQEQEFMLKYGKKNQSITPVTAGPVTPDVVEEPVKETHCKKAKRKRGKDSQEDITTDDTGTKSTNLETKLKKNTKKSFNGISGGLTDISMPIQSKPTPVENESEAQATKKKRSKKRKLMEGNSDTSNKVGYDTSVTPQVTNSEEEAEEASIQKMEDNLTQQQTEVTETNTKRKKKKKSSKSTREIAVVEENNDQETSQTRTTEVLSKKKKKRETAVEVDSYDNPEPLEDELKRKKKKCKEESVIENTELEQTSLKGKKREKNRKRNSI